MRKNFTIGFLVVILLLVSLGLIYKLFLPDILKAHLTRTVQVIVKSNVEIERVGFGLDGSLNVENIRIKNPPNFSKNNIIQLEKLFIKIKPATLLSDTLYIENINFNNVTVLVELNHKIKANTTEFVKQIKAAKKNHDEKIANDNVDQKIIIKRVSIEEPTLVVISKKLSINKEYQLENIEITNIGSKENGLYPEEIVSGLFVRISDEAKRYTMGLTKRFRSKIKKKGEELIKNIKIEEKNLNNLRNDIENKLKEFGVE